MNISELLAITTPTPLTQLSDKQLLELQKALSLLGYPVGDIDGLLGPKTSNAWAEFKTDVYSGNPTLIGKESIATLREKIAAIKDSKRDFSGREGTIDAIVAECRAQGIGLDAQIAYVLATAQWETNQTFEPVREAYWTSESWREKNLRYAPYYGRGYVQLTWENNYQKYSQILEKDLVNDPDAAMQPDVALFVLVHGFKTGTFTGRKISDYISDGRTDFINARRCINGSDRAHEIADLAKKFLTELHA